MENIVEIVKTTLIAGAAIIFMICGIAAVIAAAFTVLRMIVSALPSLVKDWTAAKHTLSGRDVEALQHNYFMMQRALTAIAQSNPKNRLQRGRNPFANQINTFAGHTITYEGELVTEELLLQKEYDDVVSVAKLTIDTLRPL